MCLVSTLGIGQTILVGTVTDESNLPLTGATVLNQTSGLGVVTDFDGNFQIEVDSNDRLVVSYIGFEDQTLQQPFGEDILVQLVRSTSLDEVVITALGIPRVLTRHTPNKKWIFKAMEQNYYNFIRMHRLNLSIS